MSNNKATEQSEAARKAKRDADFELVLDGEARRMFEEGSPDAPESAWQSVRDEYRKKVLLRRSEAAAHADTSHRIYRW